MNLSSVPWPIILLIAVAVIGCVEWLKGFAKKAPTWIWAVVSLVLCAGFAAGDEYIGHWVLYGGVAMALIKFGYELFIKGIPALIAGALGNLAKPQKTENATPCDTAGVPRS